MESGKNKFLHGRRGRKCWTKWMRNEWKRGLGKHSSSLFGGRGLEVLARRLLFHYAWRFEKQRTANLRHGSWRRRGRVMVLLVLLLLLRMGPIGPHVGLSIHLLFRLTRYVILFLHAQTSGFEGWLVFCKSKKLALIKIIINLLKSR